MMEGVKDRRAEFRQSLAYMEIGMNEPKVFNYIDGGYIIADKFWSPKYKNTDQFDRILIPPGENKPLCMFNKKWRAKRDVEANQKSIHYRQFASWLNKRR